MPVKQSLAGILKKAKAGWNDIVEAAKSGTFEKYPDGKYIFKLAGYEVKESKGTPPSWGVLFQWMFMEGELADKINYEWISLMSYDDETEFNKWLVLRLEKLTGTDASELDITELETILEDVKDTVWQATLKSGKTREDGTVNQYLTIIGEADASDYEAEKPTPAKKSSASTTSNATVKQPATTSKSSTTAKKAPAKKKRECPVEVGDIANVIAGDHEGLEVEITAIDEDEETVSFEIEGKKVRGKATTETVSVDYDEVEKLEEPDADEPTFSEGEEVTFTVTTGKGRAAKTEEFTGIIDSVDADEETCEIKVGTGRKAVVHTVAFVDITPSAPAEEEEEEEEETVSYEVGQTVKFESEGKELEGTVKEIDEDEQTLTVTVKVGRKNTDFEVAFDEVINESEEEEEEGDEDDIDPEVGMIVAFTPSGGKEINGNITAIDSATKTATIKVGAKHYKNIPFDDCVVLEEEK